MNREQFRKILNLRIEIDNVIIIWERDEDDFIKFCNEQSYDDKIPEEVLKWIFKNRTELLFKTSSIAVAIHAGAQTLMNPSSVLVCEILPKLAQLAKSNPGFFEIFTSISFRL